MNRLRYESIVFLLFLDMLVTIVVGIVLLMSLGGTP